MQQKRHPNRSQDASHINIAIICKTKKAECPITRTFRLLMSTNYFYFSLIYSVYFNIESFNQIENQHQQCLIRS